jgi:UDP-glucuronate decarboxylase
MKRAVVTGGAGFLGSHLCDSLLKDGYFVHALDNLQTGSLKNIEHLYDNKNFKFDMHDVKYPMVRYKADEYWNLACPASPPKYQADPVDTMLTCVLGAKNVMEAAHVYGAKVFQASTSEVYGDPQVHPQPETYRGNVNPTGPRSCYDEGKRAAETLMTDYKRMYGTDLKIVRIFNTYGPRMDPADGRVVSNFIMQALQNKPITIYGSGMQTRSFCYVSDMIRGFRMLMDRPKNTGSLPINIGTQFEFTVGELAELILQITGSKSTLVYEKLPMDDPTQRRPDTSKAEAHLGWRPRVELKEGLERTILFFKHQLDKA